MRLPVYILQSDNNVVSFVGPKNGREKVTSLGRAAVQIWQSGL